MTTQTEALRLADALSATIKQVDAEDDVIHVARWFVEDAAAELRRLAAENEALQNTKHYEAPRGFVLNPDYLVPELRAQRSALLEALKLALSSHGVMLMSDPPQDAWKVNRVEERARAAIAKAEGGQ